MRGVRHGWAQEKFDPSSRVRVCGSMSVIVGRRCELGLGLGLGHEEDEEATCGRVEYGRSARRYTCCDDGPLSFAHSTPRERPV